MMTIDIANTANRACSLIYSFIKEQDAGVWLLPVNVCPDVPLTFYSAKIPFEFVDINPTTLCIDENECLALLKKINFGLAYQIQTILFSLLMR